MNGGLQNAAIANVPRVPMQSAKTTFEELTVASLYNGFVTSSIPRVAVGQNGQQ